MLSISFPGPPTTGIRPIWRAIPPNLKSCHIEFANEEDSGLNDDDMKQLPPRLRYLSIPVSDELTAPIVEELTSSMHTFTIKPKACDTMEDDDEDSDDVPAELPGLDDDDDGAEAGNGGWDPIEDEEEEEETNDDSDDDDDQEDPDYDRPSLACLPNPPHLRCTRYCLLLVSLANAECRMYRHRLNGE